jgi:hypothetical protein
MPIKRRVASYPKERIGKIMIGDELRASPKIWLSGAFDEKGNKAR